MYTLLKKEENSLSWKNVKLNIGEKYILNDVSGIAPASSITAIMGPSGSGKTSLLNVLAARTPYSKNINLSGKLFVNNSVRNEEYFKRTSAYVMQNDILYTFLTVEETLFLAISFYYPEKSFSEKETIVYNLIIQLGLTKVTTTLVGNEKVRGLSGGEKKRVSIGVELVSEPDVLFLDEPTSGLDSFQAFATLETLHALALDGKTIVTSLHQPRSSIMDLIDNLVLITEGQIVYCGPSNIALEYLNKLGFKLFRNFNPADFYLDLIAIDYRSESSFKDSKNRVNFLTNEWSKILLQNEWNTNEETLIENKHKLPFEKNNFCIQPNNFYINNIQELMYRAWLQNVRNTFALKIKIFTNIFFALVLGGIYSNHNMTQKAIQDKIGILFFIAINQSFSNIVGIINLFPVEKIIVQKEIDSNAYNLISYYVSKVLVELPFAMIGPVIFGVINYWIVGLNPIFTRFMTFIGILILESFTALSLGIFISSLSPSVDIATALAPPLNVIFFLFAGVFINLSDLPKIAQWFPYISFIRWGFQGLVINEFSGQEFICDENEDTRCLKTGNDVLEMYSLNNGSIAFSCIMLVVIWFVFILLGYFMLLFGKQKYSKLT